MRKYDKLIRTTIGEYLAQPVADAPILCGVYVIAAYPCWGCLYVGIADNVRLRMMQHVLSDDDIGTFLRDNMAVSCGWRLDILTAPGNDREWMRQAEREVIHRFHPLLNTQHI